MAAGKETVLLNTEKLADKADLKKLAEQLNELIESDEWKKKLTRNLDKRVSEVLRKNWIVWQIQEVYKKQDDPKAKAWLERLMKLADVDVEVRDEQREINVRLEALREQQELSQEIREDANKLKDAIKVQLTTKINELYSKWDYQWALDNAVYLLSAQDKVTAFSMIKAILKATPSNETLYIKDKKISYSKRREWIQKMENNFEAAAREFQASYYPDVSISDEWTLDESSKKHSDKKAAKLLDKELSGNKDLYDIIKHVNVSSAWELIEKNYKAIEDAFKKSGEMHPNDKDAAADEFKNLLKKEFFVSHGYLPKSWEKLSKADDLKDKEWNYLLSLCAYRVMSQHETPVEGKPSAKAAYDALVLSQVAWVSTSELEQARTVLQQVDVDKFKVPEWLTGEKKVEAEKAAKQKAKETLMTLLWDLNWDGRVTNTSRKEWVDRKWLDKWTLFWGQVLNMFDTAMQRFGEGKVIGNIEAIIQKLNWLSSFTVNPKTIEGLVAAFKNNPSALIAFRNKLMNEPDAWNWMFNVGTDYVDRRIQTFDRESQKEAQFRNALLEHFKWEEAEKILNTIMGELDAVMEKDFVETVLPNLKEYLKTDDFNNLPVENREQIQQVVDLLSTEGWRKKLLSSPSIKEMYRNYIISSIWLSFSDISVDDQHKYWVWVWWSISSQKFNEWLSNNTKNIISKASASAGMYCVDGNVSLGLWLGFGSSTNLSENARAYYNVNAISWSPFNPKGLSFGAVVWAETRVNPGADDSLDSNAAHYIWVSGAYGFWINLSDSDFNAHNISLCTYWKKDKIEWADRRAEQVREKMVPIFQHLFEIEGDVTVQSIVENLRGGKMNNDEKFNWFARTSWETLYRTAVSIFNMFNLYKTKLSAENPNKEAIIKKISENFADNLAREMKNKDIERIVNEGLHLSWASIGVSWSFARMFTWFFLSWWLTFTYYEDSEYKENPAALKRAEKGMENEDNYDIITNETETYEEKMDTMNRILHWTYLAYTPEYIESNEWRKKVPAAITLSKDIFGQDIKVLCHPDLAPYIIQENGEIKMPGNADVALAEIKHQWKLERTLILGAKSTKACEAITLDNGKLKWTGNSTVEFGSKKEEFDQYNTVIEITQVEKEVGIDWEPSEALLNYLKTSKWSDALVDYRLSGQWKKFAKFIKDNPGRWGETESGKKEFIEKAKSYLPSSLKTIDGKPAEFTVEDIRFIYASLSRVSQTRDKQLEGDTLGNTARDYLGAIRGLSEAQKKTLNNCINTVSSGHALSKTEWEDMAKILKIDIEGAWNRIPSKTNERKLFNILTPIRYLADKRTSVYEDKIRSEYKSLPWGADVLIKARKEALEKLNWKPTATGEMKKKWIGAVAWYDLENQIDDKFLSSPKIVEGSEYVIDNNTANINVVKQHYLEELAAADWAQLAAIRDQIVVELEKSVSDEDKKLAATWKAYKFDTDVPSRNKFVEELLKTTTKDKDWHDIPKVSFNLSYAFFADCVNETILLWNIKITTLEEKKKPASHDVRYYEATIVNDAVTIWHSFSIWATVGKIDTKQPEQPEEPTKTVVEKEQTQTKPLSDLNELEGNNDITEVDFDGQEFVWKDENGKIRYMNYVYDADKWCYMAYDFDDDTNPSWIMLEGWKLQYYDTWKSSSLSGATEVTIQNFDDYQEKVSISWRNLSQSLLQLNWQIYQAAHANEAPTERRKRVPHKVKASGKPITFNQN